MIGFLFAQQALTQDSNTYSQPQKKIALVIGNANYLTSILANPENDARAIGEVLQKLGFTVFKYENLNQSQMKKAIDDFGSELKGNDIGLFYYAGHGIQSKGYNYLIPVDAKLITEKQVEYDCVQADRILALMEGSGSKVNILILDACRNNPFERSWTRAETGMGLAFMNAPKGTLIAYATSPGSTASDGSGEHGLYTSAILESILIPNITILQMFQNVRSIVSQKSNDKQTPWESTSLTGDFYFNSGEIIKPKPQEEIIIPSLLETSVSEEGNYIIDSRDQQKYKTVTIGNQVWMAENLRTNKFNDNNPMQLVDDYSEWINFEKPSYCFYKNNPTTYKTVYGALYNWFAVNTGKLCPVDWHIPSESEWGILITKVGGRLKAGCKLKESGILHWKYPNKCAINESGFTALPGGIRSYKTGEFNFINSYGVYWSSDRPLLLFYNYPYANFMQYSAAFKINYHKTSGASVRCIKNN